MDLVISAATHRSGSTMLQRVFNARNKTLIWGENGGCLIDFSRIYEQTNRFAGFDKQRNAYFQNGETPNQWIACMTPPKNEVEEAIIRTVKVFHESLYVSNYSEQHDLIGYKEVRYGKKELHLLRKSYPDCNIILLIRNPIDVWKSVSSKNWKDLRKLYGSVRGFTRYWNSRVEMYLEMSQSDPNVHLVRYEDISAQKRETMELIKQLGRLEDKDIKKVLSKKINSTNKPLPKDTQRFIKNQCGHFMKEIGYLDQD